jgi:hypothetical protein
MEEVRGNYTILMHEMKEGLQKNTDALTDMRLTTVTLLEQMLVQLTLFNTNQTTPATSTTENKPAQQGRSAAELLEHLTWSKSNRTGQSQDKVEQPQGEKPAQMKNATSTAWENPAWIKSNELGYGQIKAEQLQQGQGWPKPMMIPQGIAETPQEVYVPKWKLTDIGVFWPDASEELSGNNEVFTDGSQATFTDITLWLDAVKDIVVSGSQERAEYIRMNLWQLFRGKALAWWQQELDTIEKLLAR